MPENSLSDEVDDLIRQVAENLITLDELVQRDWIECDCGGAIKTIGLSRAESPGRILFVVVGACVSCNQFAIASMPRAEHAICRV